MSENSDDSDYESVQAGSTAGRIILVELSDSEDSGEETGGSVEIMEVEVPSNDSLEDPLNDDEDDEEEEEYHDWPVAVYFNALANYEHAGN